MFVRKDEFIFDAVGRLMCNYYMSCRFDFCNAE